MSDRRNHRSTSLGGHARRHGTKGAYLALAITGLTACQGVIGEPMSQRSSSGGVDTTGTSGPDTTGAGAGGTTGSGGGPGGGGASTGGSGGTGGGGGTSGTMTLPARIRRLTTAEYDSSVNALLGITSTFGKTFTPDARQDGFTRNDAQRVDPVFIMQADDAAIQLATQARNKFSAIAPCSNATTGGEACARTFAQTFGTRAYRRPVTPREIDALVAVYRVGAEGAAYADGIESLIHAVLMSPGFLYVTELGTAAPAGTPSVTLTPFEIASAMSYLLTGAPPDDALLAAAASSEITTPDARQTHARRLIDSQAAGPQVVRIVEEWLGIDRITDTAKDSNVYPEFATLKDAMKREADAFVGEVMWKTTRDVKDLLSADWTIADDNLAQMYGGTPANGRVSLANVPRRGVLNQGAFLSVNAHASETGPVLRGVSILRRIACVDMPSPTSLNINVVPPVPDPKKTTRERFTAHVADPTCANCHKKIDSFGFAFENFDGMGKVRSTDNGKPIDSTTTIALSMDFDGAYADSSALVTKLATSPAVRACFARHLFRAAAANSDPKNLPAENAFISTWSALPEAKQSNLTEILVAWLGSDTFIQRSAAP